MTSERKGSAKRPPAAVGDVYERLTIIEFLDRRQNSKGEWIPWVLVECSCENRTRKEIRLPSLRSGNTRSCGCLASETTRARTTTHGDHKTRLYGIWSSMKYRCKNTTHRNAHRYSLKGVTVCNEWQNFVAFRGWALANGYMDGKEIDRIDTNLGYSPDNCRWVTKLENLDNRAKYLPADLEEWLYAHARRTDSSPYEVIKAALEAYLDVSRTRA